MRAVTGNPHSSRTLSPTAFVPPMTISSITDVRYNVVDMKTLKLDHALAKAVLSGEKRSTWRINDDKNLSVNDDVELIDKVDSIRPDTWKAIGIAHIDKIVEKRLRDVTDSDFDTGHERYASVEQMLESFRGYYGDTIDELTPVKMIHFSFLAYDKPHMPATQLVQYKHVKLYADGGSRGNPGPSASGYVLLGMDDTIIEKSGVYLGITTNNQAEYRALKYGLEDARRRNIPEVEVYMDSLLVINQMKGIFKVKNRDLWPVHDDIKALVKQFQKVTFTHVPRELNRLADAEVNDTLDAELKA